MTESRFHPRPTRVAVVGVGNVGATFAYALLLSGLAAEIVLIDANHAKAEGEAMDLNHTVPFAHPTRIWAGDYSDCAGAAVTVLAAGSNQKPGETRIDLVKKNAAIWRSIVPEVAQHNPDGILLVATNPVDVLTYAALKLSGLPSERVIGSGTILDTSRFRYLLEPTFWRGCAQCSRLRHRRTRRQRSAGVVIRKHCGNALAAVLQGSRHSRYDRKRWKTFSCRRGMPLTTLSIERAQPSTPSPPDSCALLEAILRDQSTVLSISSLIQRLPRTDRCVLQSAHGDSIAAGLRRFFTLNWIKTRSISFAIRLRF